MSLTNLLLPAPSGSSHWATSSGRRASMPPEAAIKEHAVLLRLPSYFPLIFKGAKLILKAFRTLQKLSLTYFLDSIPTRTLAKILKNELLTQISYQKTLFSDEF